MLGRPCITTITPHQFTPQLATSPSSSQSTSPSRCVMPLPFSRRFPLVWSVIVSCVTLLLTCIGVPSLVSAQDCVLQVPANPLSIAGLATPWVLSGAGCSQANANSMTFVQGAVIDVKTGAISIYNPLVVDQGRPAFAAPVIPKINQVDGFVVAYWVQTHASSITLVDNPNSPGGLRSANCTNGLPISKFGKFAFCNAWAFYVIAKQQTAGGNIVPAPLGTGSLDGQPCPSIRDYSFIGRDTHMTVMTSYLLNVRTSQTAHNTPANNLACNGACIVIQSDSARLLSNIEATIGCALWVRPDLTDANNQQQASALPLNQIQAAVYTAGADPNTVALVPANDILATVDGVPNLQKLNLIRDALFQPEVPNLGAASTAQYCMAMTIIPPPRLANDAPLLRAFQRQGDTNEATNLYTLVVKRQIELYTKLGCPAMVAPTPFAVVPADWTVNSQQVLEDATPIQPLMMRELRCQNMFILDTKCSFLVCLLVVGGGIIAGCVGIFTLRVLQAWKYGDRTKQDSTRGAIRV